MIQRRCGEALRQRRVLEVYEAELYIGRECDSAFGQMFALDGLTLGVSDLGDAKPCRPARLARQANISIPAPSSTYCPKPLATASLSESSA
jgi:hypothetical protein